MDRPTFRPVRAGIGGFDPETSALASLRVAWNIDGKPFFAGPQDLLDQVLKQLMQATTPVELLKHIERLLGPTSFAAGVVYGAGESVILSVVELLDLLKTFVLAELYDKINGVPAASRSNDPGIAGRIYNFAGAVWGRFVNELLKPAAEERDEIVREIARIFEDPMAFFGKVAEQYVDKYRRFKILVANHSVQSQFEAGKIFGEILLEVILLFIAGAGAVKTAAKAPKLVKLAKRLKGKLERKPQKALGAGDAPPRPPSEPPPQTRPKPKLKESTPEPDPPPAAAAGGSGSTSGGGGAQSYGGHKSSTKWKNQMQKRGWTEQQIDEAIAKGKQFPATNNVNPANGATRYVHPATGRSVVIDNITKDLLHVGGDGFKY